MALSLPLFCLCLFPLWFYLSLSIFFMLWNEWMHFAEPIQMRLVNDSAFVFHLWVCFCFVFLAKPFHLSQCLCLCFFLPFLCICYFLMSNENVSRLMLSPDTLPTAFAFFICPFSPCFSRCLYVCLWFLFCVSISFVGVFAFGFPQRATRLAFVLLSLFFF